MAAGRGKSPGQIVPESDLTDSGVEGGGREIGLGHGHPHPKTAGSRKGVALNVVDEELEVRESVGAPDLLVARIAPSVKTEKTLPKVLVGLWQ